MVVLEYKVEVEHHPETLATAVEADVVAGWVLSGGVSIAIQDVTTPIFAQALTRNV